MKTISIDKVKNNFNSISNMVESGEPVTITQYGTPTIMILPFKIGEKVLRIYKAISMCDFMKNMSPLKESVPKLSLEEIKEIISKR